jgi:hypothetical protein
MILPHVISISIKGSSGSGSELTEVAHLRTAVTTRQQRLHANLLANGTKAVGYSNMAWYFQRTEDES